MQSGRFIGNLLGRLKVNFPLIKNWITPLTKSIFILLALTAAASATEQEFNPKKFSVWEQQNC